MRRDVGVLFCLTIFFILAASVLAVDCFDASHSSSEGSCEADAECNWVDNGWGAGGWCEQKGCWTQYSSNSCSQSDNASSSSFINKSCFWKSSTSTGWCGEVNCWSLGGTNQSACESNSYGLSCTWVDTYDVETWQHPCDGPWEKGCFEQTTSAACTAIEGCTWGSCESQNCWSANTASACATSVGETGGACKWNAQYSYCYEAGCVDYTNSSDCTANNCQWAGGSCYDTYCSDLSYSNESSCVNNTHGLNCNWQDPYCEEVGCWSQTTEGTCAAANSSSGRSCYWDTMDSSGWCEEISCWNWDGTNSDGNESNCLANGTLYGLGCAWGNETGGVGGEDGWCYKDISSDSCTDITNNIDCWDTSYCFWNTSGSTCQDPVVGSIETVFKEWYPGCDIFDFAGQSACENMTGCSWDATTLCTGNSTITNTDSSIGGVRCGYINNSDMCNEMSMLPHCCQWQGDSCSENKLSTKCWDDQEELPEGATYCEDFNSYTDKSLCEKISSDPWYMPCRWDNKSTTDNGDDRCEFKFDKVFEEGKEDFVYIDSKQVCETAGGKWVLDKYPSTTDPDTAVLLSFGHCEQDFGGEKNCDVQCYACDYKNDGTNHSSLKDAEKACYSSKLGICDFNADSTKANGYGSCRAKPEFTKGLANDCDEDCGSCTFMGDPNAAEAEYRPSNYCKNSKVVGGCKWIPDLDNTNDESKGRCTQNAEKTCEDRCDLCYTEDHCNNLGKKGGNTSLDTQCTWDDSTSTCSLTSGGEQMEICWDGIDNNNNGKMDCADSQCFSDSFCGGGFMAGFGGQDCFGYDTESECGSNGCAWISENWGSWCDMPGAQCWSNDGNEAACALDGNCTWHSGFGGFCEENWTVTDTCLNLNQSNCNANVTNNCTWIQDSFFSDFDDVGGESGWCDPNWAYIGDWPGDHFCAGFDSQGESACITAGSQDSNNVYPCSWFASGTGGHSGDDAYEGGWCDHMKFSCHQFDTEATCLDQTNVTYNHSEFCVWKTDEWGSWCEGKTMSGEGSSDSCWNQNTQSACESASCSWISGFCDPVGFGDHMGFGGTAGSDVTSGGSGMTCFNYRGNQTGCEAQQGCGWIPEVNSYCDIDIQENCPQYSYNKTVCESKSRCTFNDADSFCGDKAHMCSWNSSYTSEGACEASSLCYWAEWGSCEPLAFNASMDTEAACLNYNVTNGTVNETAFVWSNGQCGPAAAATYFKEMEGGEPISLGVDTEGDVAPPEIDILDYGMKDMGQAFGFGIKVSNLENATLCNGFKLSNGVNGKGHNTTKFYWYLDTNGSSDNGCSTRDSNNLSGFEFYFTNVWQRSGSTTTETTAAFKCNSGTWVKAPIPVSTGAQQSCAEIKGGMVVIQKTELDKFPTLYTAGEDIRIYVATGNATANITNPTDTISSGGYATPGAFDQDIESLELFSYKNASKRVGEGSEAGYISYGDVDCWTEAGCSEYECKAHPYCVNNSFGVEASTFTDTRVPKVTGLVKEVYPDGADIKFYTDKPSNGSLTLYDDSSCDTLNTTVGTVNDIGVNNSFIEDFRMWHLLEVNGSLAAGINYYYKLTFCDNETKCGSSKCSKFVTEESASDCAFCDFVTRINVPSGWNVTYDKDQDGVYEFDQNAFSQKVGMLANYSDGRRVNIRLLTDDNSSWIEFINAKLSKTGLNTKVRTVSDSGDLNGSTTTDADGNTLGYVGMIEETRDKIINNLFPERCLIKFPKGETGCTELFHCDNTLQNCINRTSEATLNETGNNYCVWELPNCQFSTWGGGQPLVETSSPSSSSPSSSGGGSSGGGGGGGCVTGFTLVDGLCVEDAVVEEEEPGVDSDDGVKDKAVVEEPGADMKDGNQNIAGGAGFTQALVDLSWLWITIVVVGIAIGLGVHLYRRRD